MSVARATDHFDGFLLLTRAMDCLHPLIHLSSAYFVEPPPQADMRCPRTRNRLAHIKTPGYKSEEIGDVPF